MDLCLTSALIFRLSDRGGRVICKTSYVHMFRVIPIRIETRLKEVFVGRGGGLVVSVLALYSDDPSSIPADYLNVLYEKTKIN